MLLMVGAVIGLAHQLHEQRPSEGIVGGAVALVGVLALFAVAAAETVVVPELGRSSEAAPQRCTSASSSSARPGGPCCW